MSTGGGGGGGGPRWRGAPARVRSTRSTARWCSSSAVGASAPANSARELVDAGLEHVVGHLHPPALLEAAAELEQREPEEPDRRDLAVEASLVAQAVHEPAFGQQVVERGPVLLRHGRTELGRGGIRPPQRLVDVDVERGLQPADETFRPLADGGVR